MHRWAWRLIFAVAIALGVGSSVLAQPGTLRPGEVIITDPISRNRQVIIDHTGALVTTANVVSHIGSVLHVAAAGGGLVIRDTTCSTCQARVDHTNALANQPHISGAIRAWRVTSCGTTAATAVASNANRRDLRLTNMGTDTLYVGYGTTGHVALTTSNGWPMHAAGGFNWSAGQRHVVSSLVTLDLPNYQGPMSCIADSVGQTLGIMEILR